MNVQWNYSGGGCADEGVGPVNDNVVRFPNHREQLGRLIDAANNIVISFIAEVPDYGRAYKSAMTRNKNL